MAEFSCNPQCPQLIEPTRGPNAIACQQELGLDQVGSGWVRLDQVGLAGQVAPSVFFATRSVGCTLSWKGGEGGMM